MRQVAENTTYREQVLWLLQGIDDDLEEKRGRFASFLQMGNDELWQNSAFVIFLIRSTDELIETASRLNSLVRTMTVTSLREEQ